ncbi:hypothetical protein TNCV_1285731 [Trichonephila clavipes]|uniref:Uncharacterized protein n=1 Tax=Trichonephila clavipes TaxID=2585209 RepID=A0A8X6SQS4_TRICX|nr:hypothetical protein TNCV_1285731 [Trichonephila clavipes]
MVTNSARRTLVKLGLPTWRVILNLAIVVIYAELLRESDEIGNLIEVIDPVRQINLEEDSDDVEELLDSLNEKLTMNSCMCKSKTGKNLSL